MAHSDFTDALKPHYSDAVRYCRALSAESAHIEAEDVLQEALLKALRNYHRLQDASKFRPWLFQIITRTYRSARRSAFWRRLLPSDRARHMPAVYDAAAHTEAHLLILKALAQVSPKERAAFLLFELSGFSAEEIRMIQGDRSLSAVKSRLSRTRKKLQTVLQKIEANQLHHSTEQNMQDLHHETLRTTEKALDILSGRKASPLY